MKKEALSRIAGWLAAGLIIPGCILTTNSIAPGPSTCSGILSEQDGVMQLWWATLLVGSRASMTFRSSESYRSRKQATTWSVKSPNFKIDGGGTLSAIAPGPGTIEAHDGACAASFSVRAIAAYPLVETLAGKGQTISFQEQAASDAALGPLGGLVADVDGNVYFTMQAQPDASGSPQPDPIAFGIRKIRPDGKIVTIAGGNARGYQDGPADMAQFDNPNGLDIGTDGTIYVADTGNARIRRIQDDKVSTLDTCEALSAPISVKEGPDGAIYVADIKKGLLKITNGSCTTIGDFISGSPSILAILPGTVPVSSNYLPTHFRGSIDGINTVFSLDGACMNKDHAVIWGTTGRIFAVTSQGEGLPLAGSFPAVTSASQQRVQVGRPPGNGLAGSIVTMSPASEAIDGPGPQAKVQPIKITAGENGVYYFTDSAGPTIRKLTTPYL